MKKDQIVFKTVGAQVADPKHSGTQLAQKMADAVKANNPGMKTHQAALEVRRGLETKFIVPQQEAKNYGAAVGQGVKQYVARLPAEKQPMAPSVAGKVAQKAYNALGAPAQKGGCGIHAVPMTKKH